jgi:chaperonin GroEL
MESLILKGEKARNALTRGINQVAECVKATLGPNGHNVVFQEKRPRLPTITNDGVTIAERIDLPDPFENLGCRIIQQAASQTNKIVGDGTTTSIILVQGFIQKGIRNIEAGANSLDLLQGIRKAVDLVISKLQEGLIEVKTIEQIKQLAIVSSGDEEIGRIIEQAYQKVGKDGVIQFELGKRQETTLEFVEGIKFAKGYLSPFMINNKKEACAELENPLILIVDDRITYIYQIMSVLECVVSSKRPLLIIAEDISIDLLRLLMSNQMRGTMKIAAVTTPGYGERRKAYLEDIAALTGGLVISNENGITLEEVLIQHLGGAKKVIIRKDSTLIIGGYGSRDVVEDRSELLRKDLAKAEDDWTKDKLRERLGWLNGMYCNIIVGGTTEAEAQRKHYLVEDALNSVKSGIEHGVLPGGGVALLEAAKALENNKGANEGETAGIKIVAEVLKLPVRILAQNNGRDPSEVIADIASLPKGFGYDALTNRYVNLMESGIFDAAEVSIQALQNAYSVASLVINSEGLITYKI